MKQPGSDIVLGIPWLWAANPMIDWTKNKIYFVKSSNSNKLYSVLNSPEGVKIFTMSVKETRKELKNPDAKILWSRWVKDDWDPVTKISIPKEYKDFEELFTAVKDQDALLKHQEWDHEIKITGRVSGRRSWRSGGFDVVRAGGEARVCWLRGRVVEWWEVQPRYLVQGVVPPQSYDAPGLTRHDELFHLKLIFYTTHAINR